MTAGAEVFPEASRGGTDVCWSEVDGLPVAWVPTARGDRLGASLIFRVGVADEALFFHGLTHLVEHLALFGVGRPPHYMNGETTSTMTSFVSGGSPAEVVDFFGALCASLRQLPLDRLDAEARIIETEAARRSPGLYGHMQLKRYGATGPGLTAMSEFAARSMSPGQLQGWANDRMTRHNAVLVLDGPPPADLRLDLPEGRRYAPPALVPIAKYMPAWFEHKGVDVAFSAVVPRSPALAAFVYVLNDALTRSLRDTLAVSYSPTVISEAYDGHVAHVFGQADCHPDHKERALNVIVQTLGRLAHVGPEPRALDDFRQQYGRNIVDPADLASWAMWEARRHLLGLPHQRAAEGVAESRDVATTDVRAVAAEALASLIYAAPAPCQLALDTAQPLPKHYAGPVLQGTKVESTDAHAAGEATLTLAPEGLMHDTRNGHTSVLFTECVAALAWPDGARELIGRTGSWIRVDPESWAEPMTVINAVDAATTAVRVPMPPRKGVPAQPVARPAATRANVPLQRPGTVAAPPTTARYTIRLTKVTSVVALTFRRTSSVTGTPAQLRGAYRRAQVHTLLLGWWGFPFGLLWTALAASRNQRMYNKMIDTAAHDSQSEGSDRFGITAQRW